MKILLVEDNKKLSMAVGIRLKANGFTFATCTDAISAVSKAVSFEPDLVMLDINLPGGDGFLVAERLMQLDVTSNTPFIFITASKKSGLREKAMGMGAVGFLEKPFDSNQLMELIEKAKGRMSGAHSE